MMLRFNLDQTRLSTSMNYGRLPIVHINSPRSDGLGFFVSKKKYAINHKLLHLFLFVCNIKTKFFLPRDKKLTHPIPKATPEAPPPRSSQTFLNYRVREPD